MPTVALHVVLLLADICIAASVVTSVITSCHVTPCHLVMSSRCQICSVTFCLLLVHVGCCPHPQTGHTPLHEASAQGQTPMTLLLLSLGGDVAQSDKVGPLLSSRDLCARTS